MNNKFITALLFFFTATIFPQTDWVKWEKAEPNYLIKNNFRHRDYTFNSDNAGEFAARSLINTYWFFISDVDGDNCPFRPSCSAFFAESVKETNIPSGSLMFFDRFTRDMNVYKRRDHYPRVKTGYYFDPPNLYSLNKEKMKYIPPSVIVNDE